jgi:murein biosynthesis integral membrane protein MurJ
MGEKITRQSVSVVLPLWVALFCFTIVVALLFQKLILPSIPSMHAGFGLMNNDAIKFHHIAEAMAAKIQASGWSWDAVWPSVASGARGNVALLAVLYALLGVNDPSLILPINATLHATSGILVLLIVQLLCPGKVGRVAGLLSAVLFVVLPSSLNWYAQVHKDGYAIAGTLLVLYAWLRFLKCHTGMRAIAIFVVASLAGVALILFVRPYNTVFLTVATALWLVAVALFQSSWRIQKGYLLVSACVWLLFLMVAVTFGHSAAQESNGYRTWEGGVSQSQAEACKQWHWQQSSWLPATVEQYAATAARTRAGLICTNFDAASNVDRERLPNSVTDIIAYMPRVFAVALLGPFPDMWFPMSATRLVGALEILVWYLLIPGVFLAIRYYASKGMMLCLLFALCYLAIYGFIIGNMGTLHRVRYPFLLLLMSVGVMGWTGLIAKSRFFQERIKQWFTNDLKSPVSVEKVLAGDGEDAGTEQMSALRRRAAGGGILVSAITLLSFLGFFFRDVLMAHEFGIGDQMDALFVAMLIPMFMVNVFGQSFGSTSVSVYMRERLLGEQHGANVVRHLAYIVTLSLLALSALLALFAPAIIPLLGWNFAAETIDLSRHLLYGALPLLLFSGMVVLGNAILSARMHFSVPAWSQAVVPLFAIGALLVAGRQLGVAAVLIGMVLGQLVNLILVQLYLRRDGLSVMPKRSDGSFTLPEGSKNQFMVLVLAAIFLQLSLLVDNGMASSLDIGSVASLGLGYKVIFFITGIIGAGISMVLLPYFASFIVKRDMVSANRELSMLMSLATLLGVITSLVVYYVAPPVMQLLFAGGRVDVDDVDTVVRVIHMGILQVPFFACQLILMKYATAMHDNRSILTASVAGMVINIILNYVLMQRMGVGGIAAATTLSMFCSASILLWMVHRQGNMSWLDVLFSGLVWVLFLTMMLCIHFRSYSGVVVSLIAMLLAIFILNSEKSSYVNQELNS